MTIDEVRPGMAVTWSYRPRGGYGWSVPVDALVVRVTDKRAYIAVSMRDGRCVERMVSPMYLRPKEQT